MRRMLILLTTVLLSALVLAAQTQPQQAEEALVRLRRPGARAVRLLRRHRALPRSVR